MRFVEDFQVARFVGTNGSMGLIHGNLYLVRTYWAYGYVWVEWVTKQSLVLGKVLKTNKCPYELAASRNRNWWFDPYTPRSRAFRIADFVFSVTLKDALDAAFWYVRLCPRCGASRAASERLCRTCVKASNFYEM